MLVLFFSVLAILVFQGFILLEEETLIVLASFVWLDAAGGLIANSIKSELEHKGDSIKENYIYFLNLKKKTLESLITLHESRENLGSLYVKPLRDSFVLSLLESNTSSYSSGVRLNLQYLRKHQITSQGFLVINDVFVNRLHNIFNAVDSKI